MKALGAAAFVGIASGSGSADTTDAGTQQATDAYGVNSTGSFEVTVDGVSIDGWNSVTIPGNATEMAEYRDGDPEHTRAAVQTTYDDLEMERDLQPNDTRIWEWRKTTLQGKIEESRRTVTVTLQDDQGTPQIEWEFTNAWVKDYGSLELDAGTYGETATESITVAYDEVNRRQV